MPERTERTEVLWRIIDESARRTDEAVGSPLPEYSWPEGRAEELVAQIRADRDEE
jgi:hypothetical protein